MMENHPAIKTMAKKLKKMKPHGGRLYI